MEQGIMLFIDNVGLKAGSGVAEAQLKVLELLKKMP